MTRAWWIGLCCLACGGSGTPAESAADAEGSFSEPATESGAADAETGQEMPAQKEAPTDSSEATPGDVQAVLQLVIEDEELNPYLHLDRPDRFPLRIAGDLPPGLQLTKATQPVEVVDAAQGKAKPVIVFTDIDVRGNQASVRYRYDIESVRGACTLEKRDGRWVLVRSRITAR